MTRKIPGANLDQFLELRRSETAVALPRLWLSGLMKPMWAGEWVGDYEPAASATYAVMAPGWRAARIQEFIRSSHCPQACEPMVKPGSWRIVMYRAVETSADPPVGVIAFTPSIFLTSDSRFIAGFRLDIELIWVSRAARGEGYGKHLVAHLLQYLEKNPIEACGRSVSPHGMIVVVRAKRQPAAAKGTVQYIDDFFELQREMTVNGEIGFSRRWGVRLVQFEAR
jgi:ribosomal protein S18 acetylase RimI-like enzyme